MNVINLRHSQQMTQVELASRSGLHRSYIGSIEQARRNVSIDNIGVLADALGVDAQSLFAAKATQSPADNVIGPRAQ
jgi:transcriptional regulator with XRE-family HTH domain